MATQNDFTIVGQIAGRLEADIRTRGLRVGDRYLSTVEAGRMLGVSPATAHRAMQLLVDKSLLVRRTRSGTFVGPAVGADATHRIRTVHVLATPEKREYASFFASHFLIGLGRAIPNVNVQFTFIPSHDPVGFVKDLLEDVASTGEVVGFVAVSCPREVYRVLADSGAPTVVSGTIHLDGPDLPSVTLDHFEAGRLLADYLLKKRHRRMALLATTLDRPGDKLLFDGIGAPLTQAGLPHNSLVFEVVSETMSSVRAAMRHLLRIPDQPTAFISRTGSLADMIAASLTEIRPHAGEDRRDDMEIVFVDHKTETVQRSPHPHVQSIHSREEGALMMGEMLKKMHEGQTIEDRQIVIPVEFVRGK